MVFLGFFFMGHGVRLNISFLMVDREMEVEALIRTNAVFGEALLAKVIGRFFNLIGEVGRSWVDIRIKVC